MNKVLIITYYWPPGSGAGVQRWLKFAKYLPAFGWEPVILTVDPEYATYPVTDISLLKEISPDLKVYRTKATDWFRIYKKDKTQIPSAGFAANDNNSFAGKISRFFRGNFFIPDPRRGWNKYAIREAIRLIGKDDIRHIITTSPPHSTQLIGIALKKRFPKIDWIADLRDPWTDIYYYDSFYHSLPARKIDGKYENEVLNTADRIITVGKSLKNSFCEKLPGIEAKTEVITNGYDKQDFSRLSYVKNDLFTISYIGTLSDSYPVEGFINAVGVLVKKGFNFRLRFVGSLSSHRKNQILSGSEGAKIEFLPFVNHKDAVRYMLESSVLLLIIPDHHSNKCIITGKLFEYLAASRPVLCIGPSAGDASEILKLTDHGRCADYSDSEGICNILEEFYKTDPGCEMIPPAEFSREYLTGRLAALLEKGADIF
jgi:glycosyltransferase involved in cell wall biosynthesis